MARAQASHAGRREDLGGGAPHIEWRPRLDRAVRLLSRLGRLRSHYAQAPQRSRRPGDPGRRAPQRQHRARAWHDPLPRARLHLSSHRRRGGGLRHAGALGSSRMSARDEIKRRTAPDIRARKGGEPIVCLTSYHAHTARLLDRHCDVILVGDSLGMVMHGLETTVPVTLDMMILQGLAVMRGSKRALVVVDMPFGSYEASKEQAFMSAARVMKETGCGAIKLEGGRRMAETIAFLVERGIPVMGHIGLTPQSVNAIGSFRAQGRSEDEWGPIEDDARSVTVAGAFSVVIGAVAEPLSRRITGAVEIPTIGIGGSVACDGQILVLEDMLGLSPRVPKFVKRYGDLGPGIEAAIASYAKEVRSRAFPGPDHVYDAAKGPEINNYFEFLTMVKGAFCLAPATSLGYRARSGRGVDRRRGGHRREFRGTPSWLTSSGKSMRKYGANSSRSCGIATRISSSSACS